ncbi:MAG: T9SS type A sorting domain-containing protein [Flavobacteriales bacterium]|nr:T9SS type A sorting domain-containing protein [Flavobacteriales bacterium]
MKTFLRLTTGIIFLFVFSFNAKSSVFVQATTSLTTANPLECADIFYSVDVQIGCINHVYSGSSVVVSGSTITVNIIYTAQPICLGAIGYQTHSVNIGQIAAGTYTVVFQGVLGSSVINTISQSLTIGSCCSSTAAFTSNSVNYCAGDSLKLTNSSSTNGTATYTWFRNDTVVGTSRDYMEILPSVGNRSYKLVSSDTCESDTVVKTIKVIPPPELGPDTSICLGDQLTLTVATGWATYKWNTNNTGRIERVSSTGKYVVTTTLASGCVRSDSVSVTVVGPFFSLGQDKTICPNGSTVLDAGVGTWKSILWSTSDTTALLTVNTPGSYIATVTNSIGCNYNDAIQVTRDKDSVLTITGADTVCIGDSVYLQAPTHFASIKWFDNDTNAITKGVGTAGNYSLMATTNTGCHVYDTVHVGFDTLPIVSLGNDTVLCNGKSWLIQTNTPNILLYRWQDASRKSTFNANKKGTYSVVITDDNGCNGTDTVVVDYKDCEVIDPVDTNKTSVNPHHISSGVSIYPNPTLGNVTVKFQNSQSTVEVQLLDMMGRVVLKTSRTETDQVELNLEGFNSGKYVLFIATEESHTAHGIILQ